MGDELFGGYPKYINLYRSTEKPSTWKGLLKLWLQRVKKGSFVLTEQPIDDDTLVAELEKCYSDKLWNPADPTASYMALDCVTQVPEQFLLRNDSYGMAYSMEGRFPLASKNFMQYCLDIPTKYKIGNRDTDTKMLTKVAYKNLLPKQILNKELQLQINS